MQYIDNTLGKNTKVEGIFKSKCPKKYLQVKASLINDGTQMIAICSDITKIKAMERQQEKMRSIFFSSVAHELRTPLNSIIPIIQMILDTHLADPRVESYLKIILNSAFHLQNVIEDALDISRLENNKFQLFKEAVDVRRAASEVCEIMKFQFE